MNSSIALQESRKNLPNFCDFIFAADASKMQNGKQLSEKNNVSCETLNGIVRLKMTH